ncbi:hypothetical protein O3M35_002490 [Rhynocoris fuscipes]|uniref:MADF domain-containing protein n=1 Tax=Rhynocoris fuscipes TaxID=488301 RepID=A0AAW1CRI7_9HEMI
MYESLPALWKVKSKEYTDRNKKSKAYDKLLEIYRERYPNATREDVAKKINSLRTNFRKELRKTNDLRKSGYYYESTLWYFNTMKFLIDEETATEVNDSGNVHEDECKVS